MIRLPDVIHGRDNNFHLLRMAAASAVLLSHAYSLSTNDRRAEPLRMAYGCTFGSIAVDLFFLVSGMLVTMSLVRRASAADFAKARVLRIWPALTVVLVLTVFVLGPAVTTLPLADYLSSHDTWRYLGANLVILKGMVYTLPGVFLTNPLPNSVNDSLWTLPSEVRCYLVLLALWGLVKLAGRRVDLRKPVACLWPVLFAWFAWSLRTHAVEDAPARLWLMFCSGVLLYLFRDRIVLSGLGALAAGAAVVLAAGHGPVFGIIYALALPYLMLCAAYLPRGVLLQYNRLGDYSYGMYIYGYPVQQTLMHLRPTLEPLPLAALSMGATLLLAVLSWHLVEQPAMRLARGRRPLVAATAAATTPA